eukprot:5695533-Amphidinium_carterae.1
MPAQVNVWHDAGSPKLIQQNKSVSPILAWFGQQPPSPKSGKTGMGTIPTSQKYCLQPQQQLSHIKLKNKL